MTFRLTNCHSIDRIRSTQSGSIAPQARHRHQKGSKVYFHCHQCNTVRHFHWKNAAVYSDEPLEPILFCLAYRAYPRWLIPGAEIPADLASPDRVGKGSEGAPCCCRLICFFIFPLCTGWAAFRNGRKFLLSRKDGGGNIEGTVTGAEIVEIGITVITGADDIKVIILFTGSKPARAGTVTVPEFVF